MKRLAAGLDHDTGADRHRVNRPRDLDHQAADADHAAIYVDAVDVGNLFGEGFHCENLKFSRIWEPALNLVFTRIVNHCVTVFGD